jgi:cytochrome c peroxidase
MRRALAKLLLAGLGTAWLAFAPGCGNEVVPPPPGVQPDTFSIRIAGFPRLLVPADNPLSRQGVALGRRLFYDPILSGDSTLSCAGCHVQSFAFSDRGTRFSTGIDGISGSRNAPALVNPGWSPKQFWDGRMPDLERQALEPVPNPIEMHLDWDEGVRRLQRHAEYPELFRRTFGSTTVTPQRVGAAIAQFERTLVSNRSRYDRFLRRETTLSASELRGYVLFNTEAGDCFHCHLEGLFTDRGFRNNGLDSMFTDPGLSAVTNNPNDRGKFKSPTLRNVALTAPYMHDGRFATLEEVLDHYNRGGSYSPTVDPLIRVGRGLGLTAQDKADIIAFLHTLTDSSFVTDSTLASPFATR